MEERAPLDRPWKSLRASLRHRPKHGIPDTIQRPGNTCEADGFVFASRFTGDSCVVIFERACGRLRATGIAEFVRHAEFLEALDYYDIVLTGPPGRAG